MPLSSNADQVRPKAKQPRGPDPVRGVAVLVGMDEPVPPTLNGPTAVPEVVYTEAATVEWHFPQENATFRRIDEGT